MTYALHSPDGAVRTFIFSADGQTVMVAGRPHTVAEARSEWRMFRNAG